MSASLSTKANNVALYYVTGVSGSGKSTVMAALQRLGYEAYDIDTDGFATYYQTGTWDLGSGGGDAAERTPEWRAQHEWKVSPKKVETLRDKSIGKAVFLCGVAANDADFWDTFTRVFCVYVPPEEVKRRVLGRDKNDYGQNPHELARILEWAAYAKQQYQELGAIIIDATQPPEKAAVDILAHVEPETRSSGQGEKELVLVSEWLKITTVKLDDAGIGTARLDALVLLEDATEHDRAWLLSHPKYELQGSVLEKLNTKIVQRVQHVPLAYIRGHTEFYGRQFAVNPHTLVPRPETETIIELLLGLNADGRLPHAPHIVDVGTGSGCIAITTALELSHAHVTAIDIDEQALQTAQQNAKALGANVTFLHGNLLEPLTAAGSSTARPDVILANLPYVPDNFQINTAATHEPRHALFGGTDGLDLYREMFEQLNSLATKPSHVLTESLPPQHEVLASIARTAGYELQQTNDFIQVFKLAD